MKPVKLGLSISSLLGLDISTDPALDSVPFAELHLSISV